MSLNLQSSFKYNLRRSERAKNIRILVKPDKIEVVAPHRTSEQKIKAFVEAQQDWIKSAIIRIAERASRTPSLAPQHYADGVYIPFQGHQYPLAIKPVSSKTVRIQRLQDESFLASVPHGLEQEQSSELIRLVLIRWIKSQAKLQASLLIEKHAERFKLFPRSLRIKTQKSRWGSCGPQNDINLNWMLMLAPPEILEYVIVHEICHIKHRNHSADFWLLVEKHLPDYLQRRHWLKTYGASLMKGL
jgi:predicted metal-dependent hydrolase